MEIFTYMNVKEVAPRKTLRTGATVPASYDSLEKKYLLAAQVVNTAYERACQSYINYQPLPDNPENLDRYLTYRAPKEFKYAILVSFRFDVLNFDLSSPTEDDDDERSHDIPKCYIMLVVNFPDPSDELEDIGSRFSTVKEFVDHVVQEVIEKAKSGQSWIEVNKKGIVDGNSVVITTVFHDMDE